MLAIWVPDLSSPGKGSSHNKNPNIEVYLIHLRNSRGQYCWKYEQGGKWEVVKGAGVCNDLTCV